MMTGHAGLRVLIVDDQAVVRIGFTSLLSSQPDLTVVGAAADGREAVRLAGQLAPDVVLMDIRMPVLGGIEATRLLVECADAPRVLIGRRPVDPGTAPVARSRGPRRVRLQPFHERDGAHG
jgi:DNA-binding NarL/FixJ family response regulator